MAQPPILSWEGLGLQQGGRWLFGGPDQDPIDLHIGARDRLLDLDPAARAVVVIRRERPDLALDYLGSAP